MTILENSMNRWAAYIADWGNRKGFETPGGMETEDERNAILGKLMLVCTEVAEAAEAVRHNDPENFREEIADTMIRLLHISGAMGIDIEREIAAKMEKNEGREYRHGKSTSL